MFAWYTNLTRLSFITPHRTLWYNANIKPFQKLSAGYAKFIPLEIVFYSHCQSVVEKLRRVCRQSSASLPASPYSLYRGGSTFTWRLQPLTPQSATSGGGAGTRRPLVQPCLENLDLPYADDSAAATPTSDDLCSFQNAQNARTLQRQQRLSTASAGIRMSQLEMRFTGGGGGVSRTGSRGSRQSRHSVVASNAAMLSAGATTTQLDVHAPPRLKVKHFSIRL